MRHSFLNLAIPCLLVFFSQVRGEPKYSFDPAGLYQEKPIADVVEVPGKPGVKGVRLKPVVPKTGWCTIGLGRTFEAGMYKIEYTVSARHENAAPVALYTAMGGSQYQITGVLACAKGQANESQTVFFSPIAFSGILIKQWTDAKTPSVAISKITLTDLGRKEYPRLAAYQALMSYAAPWGLRSSAIERKKEVGEIEAWLDLRSGAAEVFSRADYLFRVIRVKKLPIETAALQKTLDTLKMNLGNNQLKDIPALLATAEKDLNGLQLALEKKLDAVVCPENGTDIFSWIKAGRYLGVCGDGEYSEPTPYRAVYPQVTLSILKPGEKTDLSSTWTTSTYTTGRQTLIYSVLTPLTVVDVRQGPFEMTMTEKAAKEPLSAPEGWFTLSVKNSIVLFVMNHKASKIDCTGTKVTIHFEKPSAVGFFVLPESLKTKIRDIAHFYQGVLLHQPVECVQIQKGNTIEQMFEYVDRSCDWPAVKPISIAPVPHLAMLSRQPQSKMRIKIGPFVSLSPDNFGYVKNSSSLTYQLPAMPVRHNLGANVFDDENTTKEMFQELRKQGCQTIRQLTCCLLGWDLKHNREAMKKFVQTRLEWVRRIGGLKIGFDLHGGWDTTTLKTLPDFIALWKELISWCKGYEDIIAWYDLLNEPSVFPDQGQPTKPYFEFMRGAVKALRPVAGKTPILIEGVSMANPGGFNYWEDFEDKNIIVGFHDYWPHLFTHQLTVEKGSDSFPFTFYPSFMPMMEWTVPSWRNECPAWHYWDRWKRDSVCEPLIRMIIEKGVRVDCGEYGVVGYAGTTCNRSGVLWMRHALQLYKRMNISHCAFSPAPNSGFTWLIPEFKEETYRFWKQSQSAK